MKKPELLLVVGLVAVLDPGLRGPGGGRGRLSRSIWGACQTNTYPKIGHRRKVKGFAIVQIDPVRLSKRDAALPIGRTARIAYEIEALRGACSQAASELVSKDPLDEAELEECARLDEALARAHRLLKAAVRNIMITRLNRRSRAR